MPVVTLTLTVPFRSFKSLRAISTILHFISDCLLPKPLRHLSSVRFTITQRENLTPSKHPKGEKKKKPQINQISLKIGPLL